MRLRHALSIVSVTGILATGCAQQASNPVLATVGSRQITLASYRDAYNAMTSDKPDLTNPDKRRAFLQDLINKNLLELEAYRLAPDLDDGQRRRLHRYAEGELLQLLQRKTVDKKAAVSDDDVKDVWNRMDRQLKLHHILTRSEQEARDVETDLQQGKSFEQEAQDKSFDTASGEKGGDLGWVSAGQMVDEFDKAAFKMSKGQISEPVHSRFGWHIIRLDDERTVPRAPFDQVKEQIRLKLLQQRSMAAQQDFQDDIKNEAKPENQMAAVDLIDKKFTFEVPPDKANDPYAIYSLNRDLPTFTAEELQMPVVKFADRPPFTIKDFNEALGWMPPGVWPKGHGSDEVEDVIRQMLRTKLYKERALKMGLDKLPEYITAVKKKENEMRVNSLYYNTIVKNINPTDLEMRDFFESHRDHYKVVERSRQARIETADSALAVKAAQLWRSGRSFDDIYAMVKQGDATALGISSTQETPRGDEPPVDTLIYAGHVNDIVGPVWRPAMTNKEGTRLAPRWVIVQILDMQPERFMTYDEAQSFVKDHAKTYESEQQLRKLLGDLEKRFPVKINDKALDAVTPDVVSAKNGKTTTT